MTRLGTRWGRPAAPGNAGSRRRRAPWSPMRTRFCLSFLSRKWLAISARHGRGASFHNPCLNHSLQLFAVSVQGYTHRKTLESLLKLHPDILTPTCRSLAR